MTLKVYKHTDAQGRVIKVTIKDFDCDKVLFSSTGLDMEGEASAFLAGFTSARRIAGMSLVNVSHETIKEEHWILRNAREAYEDLSKRHNSEDISIDIVFREDKHTRRMSAKEFLKGYKCQYSEVSFFSVVARYNRMPITAYTIENVLIYSDADLLMGRTQLLKTASPSYIEATARKAFEF